MTCILSLPDYSVPAQRLAARLKLPWQLIEVHRFPDGESRVQVPVKPPRHVIICQSLDRPNSKLVELLLAVETLRHAGTKRVSLVVPYLCYMRQDKAFRPGEAISQQIIGRFLGQMVDDVITVDAHLHRINHLAEVIPLHNAINLSAAPALGAFLAQQEIQPLLLLGPDAESRQWVKQVAASGRFDSLVATKQRFSDRKVQVSLPEADYRDRIVVLVDDIVSSGHTLAESAMQLKQAGARKVCGLVTHALFSPDAIELLHQAGIEDIWSSDSICHETNVIHLDQLLAEALTALL